ncbi:N-acetyltransferase GCN5 [Lelliottia amnigena]|nr:N-acetyltransferase GCN5 [Lelliottia amnigena]
MRNGDCSGMDMSVSIIITWMNRSRNSPGKGRLTLIQLFLCRVAETEGKAIGFALCVLHEGTWTTAPICYLEDLYVDADARGMGAGKALLDALQSEGKREGWSMLYWMTRQENPARRLYDRYAGVDDFVRYRVPL